MRAQREIFLPLTYLERRGGFRGALAGIARDLLRVTAEKPKPNGDRLREYRDSTLPSLEQRLFSSAPVYRSLESNLLAESLAEMRDELGADNPTVMRVLGGKGPEARAKEIIAGTKLDDVSRWSRSGAGQSRSTDRGHANDRPGGACRPQAVRR
jgi:hypothetical protein